MVCRAAQSEASEFEKVLQSLQEKRKRAAFTFIALYSFAPTTTKRQLTRRRCVFELICSTSVTSIVRGLLQGVNRVGFESKLNSKYLLVSTGTDVLKKYKEMISNTRPQVQRTTSKKWKEN